MTAPRLLALALALLCAFGGRAVRAEEPNPSSAELENLYETVGQLEKRIAELESSKSTRSAGGGGGGGGAEWPERLRLSGSADLNYLQASGSSGEYGLYEQSSTQIYDARVFLDANLGSDARLGDVTVYRDAGFTFEWNVVRLGYAQNNIGDLYGDLRGLLGYEWLNLEIGRFQIPYGENYLRFGKGRPTDPFIALTASPPWFWDEGLKLWGKTSNGHFGYVASVTDGEGGLNRENNDSKQVTLKLTWDPSEWMHLSASALRTGSLGSNDSPAFAAVWLGESIPAAFGSNTGVPSFDHGQEIADGPNKLRNVVVLGGPRRAAVAGGREREHRLARAIDVRPQPDLLAGRAHASAAHDHARARAHVPGAARERPRHVQPRRGLPARLPLRQLARLQHARARRVRGRARTAAR